MIPIVSEFSKMYPDIHYQGTFYYCRLLAALLGESNFMGGIK
jgi:hypothetical protein